MHVLACEDFHFPDIQDHLKRNDTSFSLAAIRLFTASYPLPPLRSHVTSFLFCRPRQHPTIEARMLGSALVGPLRGTRGHLQSNLSSQVCRRFPNIPVSWIF